LYVITKGVWGGAQKYVYSLAVNLPKDQFEAVVVCGQGGTLKEKLEEQNIRVIEIDYLKRDISIFSELKSFLKLFNVIKEEDPDVMHLNSPKASGLGALAGRLLGVKKIVFTAHGWTFNEDRNFASKSMIWLLSWVTVILSHKVIVIARRERAQALNMPFVSRNKIELIKNGVEKIDYLEKAEARKGILPDLYSNFENNTIWIGTMAELHKNKGYEYTIEALSKIEKPFVFVALGEGEERKNLENLIREYRLEEKVFLVGFKDKSAQYLKAFDIFTLTSIKEGLPYTLIEAGFAGLPVVASNIGGIPDIIDNNVNGILTESRNVPEIKNAIEKLMENSKTRNAFGNKLKEKVEKEFSLEQMLEKTLSLYNN
jgi:glycosyltransferase involved in cell wall biosynthesis